MTVKDEIVLALAKTLKEFMNLSGLKWGTACFRFLAKEGGMCRTEWVHTFGNQLLIASPDDEGSLYVEEELEDKYLDILTKLFFNLYAEFEKEGTGKPAVSVLKVTQAGEYKIDFDYNNRSALQIGNIHLGQPNSYFKPGEIDIPDHILDFQNELGKVTRDES